MNIQKSCFLSSNLLVLCYSSYDIREVRKTAQQSIKIFIKRVEKLTATVRVLFCFVLVWFGLVWFGLVWFGLV